MFRRGVSVLAVLGYLAGQLAAIPHAHAGGSPHDHEFSQPHFHLLWFGGAHPRHPHLHDDAAVLNSDRASARPKICRDATDDHDDDAIYLSPVSVALAAAGESHLDALNGQTAVSPIGAALFEPVFGVAFFAWREHPPDSSGRHCALFVALRTLRI